MVDEPLPTWAVELVRQITILNEKLPTHIEWVERTVGDHEVRIRKLEDEDALPKAIKTQLDKAGEQIAKNQANIESLNRDIQALTIAAATNSWVPRLIWIMVSGVIGTLAGFVLNALFGA